MCLVHEVLTQDYTEIELIVVNDGSKDDTTEALAQIKDTQLKVINKANGGVSSARNTGIDAVRGKYITFIDDDNIPIDYISSFMREEYEETDFLIDSYNSQYDENTPIAVHFKTKEFIDSYECLDYLSGKTSDMPYRLSIVLPELSYCG